ncbi:MAG: tannase/feruloyl esterase family alpha/beta hydrolase [Burkholderiaceae bacterium]|nr:tannase/feruloyl esterase family alpha/beta hydrolase [Burkholderiaceae bacterium]
MGSRSRTFLLASAVLAGCGSVSGTAMAAGPLASREACEGLKTAPPGMAWPNASTVVTAVNWRLADAAAALPEHCEVVGAINRRTGVDGYPYEIKFRLRLPVDWNGRFFMEGGSGTNGVLSPALGDLRGSHASNALSRHFATASTDSGHDNTVNNNPKAHGIVSFGMDPQARLDQGYNAYDQVTQAGKAAVAKFYGRSADKSYFIGCSEGGRGGMMMSQRFPQHFDGIVAGAPGYQLPKAGIAGGWTTQAMAPAAVGTDPEGVPLINKSMSDPDLNLLAQSILGRCDALDGLVDGIVDNHAACQAAFDPSTAPNPATGAPLQCTGDKTADCLSKVQVDSIKRAMSGPVDSAGNRFYSAWPWDPGISGRNGTAYNQGWRLWWLGTYDSKVNNAQRVNGFSASSWLVLFATPPEPVVQNQLARRTLNFDFKVDPPKILATSGPYTPSMQWHAATSTDLTAFRDRGGKLILWHGMSDAAFSALDTVAYYERLGAAMPSVQSFSRLFLVPGMGHCSGGPSTDSFDMLTPLVEWVENKTAPAQVTASATAPGYFGVARRSRPLCPYPSITRYKGSGDINDASNFTCSGP